jgi:hypothetical protein
MKNIFLIFTLVAFIVGCQSKKEKKASLKNVDSFQTVTNVDTLDDNVTRTYITYSIPWSDSLLKMYIAFSENQLIKLSRKEEEWIFDQTIKTDTAVYNVYQIGHDVSDENGKNLRFITDQWIYLDTTKKLLYEYDVAKEKLNEWWAAEGYIDFFYPVYKLSPKTTAIVISFSEDGEPKGILDSLFQEVAQSDSIYMLDGVPKTCTMYDSSGTYRLLKSNKLEKEARKYYDREYYVYGTKGYVKTGIKDIVYGLDECRTNVFAFCLDKSSLKSIGQPVFCSPRLIDLTYSGKYSNIEKRLQGYHSQLPADYRDSMKTKVAGNVGDFYFTYNDDFLWGQKGDRSKCYFPARCIFYVGKKEAVINFDTHWLDLFGIECD